MAPRRRFWLLAGAIVAICGVLVALAPWLIERRIASQLEDMGDGYRGSFDDVSLRPLAGEIAILGLRVERVRPRASHPFLTVREFVIGVTREGLRPRSYLRLIRPEINWIDARNDALDQWGPPFELAELREQLPFELASVEAQDGELHFRAPDARPAVDVQARRVDVRWDNLAGCLPPGNSACRSELRGRAGLMGAALLLRGDFARTPPDSEFKLRGELNELSAVKLSPVLLHYAEIDVQGGTVSLDVRYTQRTERYSGLIVPRLQDLKVMGGDRKETRFGRELGLAMAAGFFERRRGAKAVRFHGKLGADDFEFDLVDNPLAQRETTKTAR